MFSCTNHGMSVCMNACFGVQHTFQQFVKQIFQDHEIGRKTIY